MTLKIAIALALVSIATGAIGAPQRRVPAHRPSSAPAAVVAPKRYDPRSYAAAIATVDCSNVAARAASLPGAETVLRGIAARYEAFSPRKGEFESTDAFNQRIHGEISADLGGTDKVVAVIPLRDLLKYDADASTVTIDPVDSHIKERVIAVKAYSDINETGHYQGSNAYGATANVTRETFTQFFLVMPANGNTTIRQTLDANTAKSLKESGSLVFVGTLLAPYIADERAHGSATISDPSDTTYLKFYLGIVPQCGIIVNQGQEIARLGL